MSAWRAADQQRWWTSLEAWALYWNPARPCTAPESYDPPALYHRPFAGYREAHTGRAGAERAREFASAWRRWRTTNGALDLERRLRLASLPDPGANHFAHITRFVHPSPPAPSTPSAAASGGW